MGASQAPDAGAVPVWRSKFINMIRIINQEEFEKCLPMLDSSDVECRLLGWELLCECTDLHRDTLLSLDEASGSLMRYLLTCNNEFIWAYGHFSIITIPYSVLIKEFTIQSKIFLPHNRYLKLKYK